MRRDRIVLAFDIDNFYVASERLRDPSLVGRPIGITQKTILATCSYEARERGVRKLCLIGDSVKLCPDIVLINGEDLTFYRRDSRRVWRLVSSIVGMAPEKLGMDELFLDVTTLVDAHLANAEDRSARLFRLPPSSAEPGFSYASGVAGVPMPASVAVDDSDEHARYAVASHLAAFIRATLADQIGFTTSAGVAPNKLLAKLLASENKPSRQTCWLPAADVDQRRADVEAYMAAIPVKNLNGFGHRIVSTLRQHLLGEPAGDDEPWTADVGAGAPAPSYKDEKAPLENGRWEPINVRVEARPLLVRDVREGASQAKLEAWFGERLGARLWGLLWGRDDEPVEPAPEFPKTISVEDSYLRAKIPTVAAALQKISTLAASLLARLEAELVDEPASLGEVTTTSARTWARHPTQMRLTLRGGPGAGSKTAPMPLRTLDLDGPPRDVRAEQLAASFHALFRKMVGQTVAARDDEKVSLHVINLAVVSFEAHAPTPSVRALLGKRKAGSSPPKARNGTAWLDASSDVEPEEEDAEQCTVCDTWVPSFAMPAHLQWHIEPG